MRWRGATIAGAVAVTAVAAGYTNFYHRPLQNRPVFATAPAPGFKVCQQGLTVDPLASTSGLGPPPASAHLWVDPNPDGGVVLWLPGMNTPCRTILTHLNAAQAQAFAHAVETSTPFPPGTYNCPNDDESAIIVYLTYLHQAQAEVVEIATSGCGGASAPGRDTRDLNLRDNPLGPTPKGWRY